MVRRLSSWSRRTSSRGCPPAPRISGTVAATVDGTDLYLSVLIVGEIRQGIERLRPRDPTRAGVFDAWLARLRRDFESRILPVSPAVAEQWGRMNARDPLPVVDSLMAATAITHGLTLVTRDTAALARTEVAVLNPFQAGL